MLSKVPFTRMLKPSVVNVTPGWITTFAAFRSLVSVVEFAMVNVGPEVVGPGNWAPPTAGGPCGEPDPPATSPGDELSRATAMRERRARAPVILGGNRRLPISTPNR